MKQLPTNIILYEHDTESKLLDVVKNKANIKHIFKKCEEGEIFHRTKFLNEMIMMSETDIVINYDADVLLPLESYARSMEVLKEQDVDFLFPFDYGNFQKEINYFGKEIIKNTLNLDYLEIYHSTSGLSSEFGHCFFAKKSKYIEAKMENEDFLPGQPEDRERVLRFQLLVFPP